MGLFLIYINKSKKINQLQALMYSLGCLDSLSERSWCLECGTSNSTTLILNMFFNWVLDEYKNN